MRLRWWWCSFVLGACAGALPAPQPEVTDQAPDRDLPPRAPYARPTTSTRRPSTRTSTSRKARSTLACVVR